MKKQTIVVKIGSSSLTNDRGEIDESKLTTYVDAIAKLRAQNHTVVLVSSGAVAAGFKQLGYASRPVTIKGRQAAAAVGQGLLIQAYNERFQKHQLRCAQLLLTRADFTDKERYQNAFSTINELMHRGIVPIINENDTVVIDELTFGDNDMLSALVSGFIHADQLIILTDINGLYTDNPKRNPDAKKYQFLTEIDHTILAGATAEGSAVGTGGMKSKIEAAKRALSLGVSIFIGKGDEVNSLVEILEGQGDGTYISNKSFGPMNTSKQWIAFHSESTGKIYIDKGAEEAILHRGKSLLAAGVIKIKGDFAPGDVVEVYGTKGLIGKGEVSYTAEQLIELVKQKKLMEATTPPVEVIHRDRWIEVKD